MNRIKYLLFAAACLTSAALSSCREAAQTESVIDGKSGNNNTELTQEEHTCSSQIFTSGSQPCIQDSQEYAGDRQVYNSLKYNQLTDNEKKVYDELNNGLTHHLEKIKLNTDISRESLCRVYDAVLTTMELQMYCPTRTYQYMYVESSGKVTEIIPQYKYTAEQTVQMRQDLENVTDNILSQLTDEMTQTDKVRYFHDYIIGHCEYDREVIGSTSEQIEYIMENSDYDNAYGVLVKGTGVCEGYARTFRYLCERTGIDCELISGIADNVQHMWNMVNIDGSWYHIDLTWDDPIVNNDPEDCNNIRYDYFNLNDEQISQSHEPDRSYFEYPEANSEDAGYYRYYDLEVSNCDQADEILKRELINAFNNDSHVIYIKSPDTDCFSQIISYLFDNNGMYNILCDIQDQADYIGTSVSISKAVDYDRGILKLIV